MNMKLLIGFIVKFVMITAVLLIVLAWIFDVPVLDAFLISLALTALSYVMGDLFIFLHAGEPTDQNTRNSIATFVDFTVAFLLIWLIGRILGSTNEELLVPALLSALILAGGEWFFHKYVDRRIMPGYNLPVRSR